MVLLLSGCRMIETGPSISDVNTSLTRKNSTGDETGCRALAPLELAAEVVWSSGCGSFIES